MAYSRTNWVAHETKATAERMNNIEEGILANEEAAAAGVKYTAEQSLTDAQKAMARANIEAGSATDVDNLKSALSDMGDALEAHEEYAEETYAKVDGSYSSMTVGNAEQLVATVGVEDSVPYNFRTSAGTADVGDREVDKIVGGTIAWNQLVGDRVISDKTIKGITWTNNNDGTFTANGTATGDSYIDIAQVLPGLQNHVILISGCPAGGGVTTWEVFQPYMNHMITCDTGNGRVSKTTSTNATCRLYVFSGAAANNIKFVPQLFDLTQMFGSTIADYIYSLEQTTTGAGVAWFRKLFPKPYYAYNPGELMSVQAAAHKMVGFNAWDEEWEVGSFDGQGKKSSASNRIRSKNFIKVLPQTTYYAKIGALYFVSYTVLFYDADKEFISLDYPKTANTFATPTNAYYINIAFPVEYGTTYNHDICINLSWDGERNGEYEPYVEYTYPLDDSLTLRGIPKLDSGNALYYDGDTYESDGTVTRRYGVLDLGTLTWTYQSGSGHLYFRASLTNVKRASNGATKANIVCNKYANDTGNNVYNNVTDKIIAVPGDADRVMVYDSAYTDAATFKAAMSGVYLVYELATPTTETADPYQSPQIVDDFGTEEYVDTGVAAETRDVAIPVGHDTFYQANLRAKLEMSPESPDGDGDYIVRQTNGTNVYVPMVKELPTTPTTEGTYYLKATVTSGGVTLTWEADS